MLGGVGNMKGEKQMIYKNITFKAAPFSYDLTFDDRITLVGGDSGTGKTVLYEMLEDIRLTDEYKAIKLFNYKSDDFLEANDFSRDEIKLGMENVADNFGLNSIAKMFLTDF